MASPFESYATEWYDKPNPSGQRSSGRASRPKACFLYLFPASKLWYPCHHRLSMMVCSESWSSLWYFYCGCLRAVWARPAPPAHTHTCGDLGASWRRVKMRLVQRQSAIGSTRSDLTPSSRIGRSWLRSHDAELGHPYWHWSVGR